LNCIHAADVIEKYRVGQNTLPTFSRAVKGGEAIEG